jgi:hypothetical protein
MHDGEHHLPEHLMFNFNLTPGHTTPADGLLAAPGAFDFSANLVPGHPSTADGLLAAQIYFATVTVVGGGSPQTITASGFAQAVGFGSAKVNQTITAIGIAQPVGIGSSKVNQTITATAIPQPIGLGTANVNQTITASGIAQAIGLGTAKVNQTITASGLAQAVALGGATVSGATQAEPEYGSWAGSWAGRENAAPPMQTIGSGGIGMRVVHGRASFVVTTPATAREIAPPNTLAGRGVMPETSATQAPIRRGFGAAELNAILELTE